MIYLGWRYNKLYKLRRKKMKGFIFQSGRILIPLTLPTILDYAELSNYHKNDQSVANEVSLEIILISSLVCHPTTPS